MGAYTCNMEHTLGERNTLNTVCSVFNLTKSNANVSSTLATQQMNYAIVSFNALSELSTAQKRNAQELKMATAVAVKLVYTDEKLEGKHAGAFDDSIKWTEDIHDKYCLVFYKEVFENHFPVAF